MTVYVVTGMVGEYSDCEWWVAGVFREEDAAKQYILAVERQMRERNAEWEKLDIAAARSEYRGKDYEALEAFEKSRAPLDPAAPNRHDSQLDYQRTYQYRYEAQVVS